jgi:exopolysaccharide biosynthesis protein
MKQKNLVLTIGLVFGLALAGGTAYNLADTFLIPHAVGSVTSDFGDDVSSSTSTSTGAASSGSASASSASSSSVASSSASPYASTSVTYTKLTMKNSSSRSVPYYVIDIKLAKYSDLKTHLATNSSGSYGVSITESFTTQVNDVGGSGSVLAAINGDFAYASAYRKGYVVRNGAVYRWNHQDTTSSNSTGRTSGDIFCTFADGTGKAMTESSASLTPESTGSKAYIDGAFCYQCFCFGPALLEQGSIQVTEDQEVYQAKGSNERTAIGYLGAYHFCFAVSDVYNHNRNSDGYGFSLYELAEALKNYGCSEAYNLDGGGSSLLYYNGAIANSNSQGSSRALGDILYVKAS